MRVLVGARVLVLKFCLKLLDRDVQLVDLDLPRGGIKAFAFKLLL